MLKDIDKCKSILSKYKVETNLTPPIVPDYPIPDSINDPFL